MPVALREIGTSGIKIKPIGLGGMPLSVSGRPSESEALKVLEIAVGSDLNFIDTADVYCIDEHDIGHNERLIAKALKRYPKNNVTVATKGGLVRPRGAWLTNGSPAHLLRACEASLKSLEIECIDLYYLHAVDDKVPFKDSLEALAALKKSGKIRNIGLSNVTLKQIEYARTILEVAAIQNRCNPLDLGSFQEGIVQYCERNSIAFVAYSPVGGSFQKSRIAEHPVLNKIASSYQANPFQVVLAWLLTKSPNLIAIPGASRVESVSSSAGAMELTLSLEDTNEIDHAFGG